VIFAINHPRHDQCGSPKNAFTPVARNSVAGARIPLRCFVFWHRDKHILWSFGGNRVTLYGRKLALSDLKMPVASTYKESRTVPRYTLVADAEITEIVSGHQLNGRLSELSRKGCYVDILSTLPKGTEVQLRFSRDRGTLALPAHVIYAQEAMGMGFAFGETDSQQMKTLDEWLAELSA
jgi:PilZ domain